MIMELDFVLENHELVSKTRSTILELRSMFAINWECFGLAVFNQINIYLFIENPGLCVIFHMIRNVKELSLPSFVTMYSKIHKLYVFRFNNTSEQAIFCPYGKQKCKHYINICLSLYRETI